MEILPRDSKQFQDEDYWRSFFKDAQTKQGFEWYATYEELAPYLKSAIK